MVLLIRIQIATALKRNHHRKAVVIRSPVVTAVVVTTVCGCNYWRFGAFFIMSRHTRDEKQYGMSGVTAGALSLETTAIADLQGNADISDEVAFGRGCCTR